jgi:diadenylate cyclase
VRPEFRERSEVSLDGFRRADPARMQPSSLSHEPLPTLARRVVFWFLAPFRWQSVVDFLVLAAAFYAVLRWAKQARAVRIALGIIGLHVAALVARHYDLMITSWVLTATGFVAIAVLLILFQPELRHAVMRLDTLVRGRASSRAGLDPVYRAMSEAAFDLAAARTGALMVVVRRDSIAELVQGGIALGAAVSRELLEAIFQKPSPLHDGAAIISGGAVMAANAVLPLTQRPDVPRYFGTRHRAALGLAERSDALVVAVSEERGTVMLAEAGGFEIIHTPRELAEILGRLRSAPQGGRRAWLRRAIADNFRVKLAAVGLAAVVWAATMIGGGATIRTVSVPVEFSNVPPGLVVASQSASEVSLQFRGNSWLINSAGLDQLVARFSLRGARPGAVRLKVASKNFNLPSGIKLVRSSPEAITVQVEPAR